MTKAYFLPLVSLPVIIDEPGKYVTRCGDVVTINIVSVKHDFGCYGSYGVGDNGAGESWHKSGRLFATSKSLYDIVGKAR